MRQFSRRALLASAPLASTIRLEAGARARPNILWIVAEDFSPDLGCYGQPNVRTPNIDRLASQGVRFHNAFVTAPVCSASRSALLTGMYQTSIGGHHHRSHRDDGYRLPDGVRPFTHYLRDAGYHTSNVTTAAPGVRGTGKTDFNFTVEQPYDGRDWGERKPEQPFFAQVCFQETHRVFHRTPDQPVDPAKIALPPYYPDHPAIREDFALYLESAQHLDRKVGAVLERLEREGLANDTIVVFFADHGRPMPRGKQFLYDEGIRIPLIVRAPAKFQVTGTAPGSVNNGLVSSIDITATTLKLAGIEIPRHMQGQEILGDGARVRSRIFAARDRCDETVDRIRCVRDARYKYVRNFHPERPYTQQNVYKDVQYPPLRVMRELQEQGELKGPAAAFLASSRPAEELYDLQADPHEVRNLAASRAHRARLAVMRAQLERWVKESNDLGAIPEKELPASERSRTSVDGWCTKSGCRAERKAGALGVACTSIPADLERSIVAEPGDYLFEFRARSSSVAARNVSWGTIASFRHPSQQSAIAFAADGEWHDYQARFDTAGSHLARISLDFSGQPGAIEFQSFQLSRYETYRLNTVATWDFRRS